jgi:hypothetical protein
VVASGIYLVLLQGPGHTQTGKIAVIKQVIAAILYYFFNVSISAPARDRDTAKKRYAH